MTATTVRTKKGPFILNGFWIAIKRPCIITLKRNNMIKRRVDLFPFGPSLSRKGMAHFSENNFAKPIIFHENDILELKITEHDGPFEYKLKTEPIDWQPVTRNLLQGGKMNTAIFHEKGPFILMGYQLVIKRNCNIIIRRNGTIEYLRSILIMRLITTEEELALPHPPEKRDKAVFVDYFTTPMVFHENDVFELETDHGESFEYEPKKEPLTL